MTLKRGLGARATGDLPGAAAGAGKGSDFVNVNPLHPQSGATVDGTTAAIGDVRPLVAVLERIERSINEAIALQKATAR